MSDITVTGSATGITVDGSGSSVVVKVTTGGGGGGGVTVHNLLTGRSDPGQHPTSAITGLDAALAGKVDDTDPRLTDSRTPTTHAASHEDGGADEITVAQSQVTGLAGDLAGKVGTTDPRLSDARTPTAHTHAAGDVSGLATVATTGAYDDLSGRPSIPAAQVNSDWSAASGVAQILNRPTIPSTPSDVGAAPAVRTVGTGLGTSGTVNLDMSALHGTIQTVALDGAATFTTSNRAAGREVTLILSAGGASRTLTWPSWLVVGAALPTTLESGKTAVITATCTDTTDAATVAAGTVQS